MGPLANSFKIITNEQNPLWRDQVVHTSYDDYWKSRNIATHLHNIHCAVLNVGGWFDAEDLEGPMKTFRTINKDDPGTVNILVEGPWSHYVWSVVEGHKLGNVDFGSDTAEYFRSKIEFPFFEQYLKGGPRCQATEGICLRDRIERLAAVRELAPVRRAGENVVFPGRRQGFFRCAGGKWIR